MANTVKTQRPVKKDNQGQLSYWIKSHDCKSSETFRNIFFLWLLLKSVRIPLEVQVSPGKTGYKYPENDKNDYGGV